MILLFGGTTEGRSAVDTLEAAGSPFFYSTKTGEQRVQLTHGSSVEGAMDEESMLRFCRQRNIRLMVDAAHPFASQLHLTVVRTAKTLGIPAVRYERIYPQRDPEITWIDDYSQIPRNIHSLLATTGVQSISRLKPLEAEGIKVYYRILNRESSISLALRQGATMQQLCFYDSPTEMDVEAEAVVMKESGLSGGFAEKVDAAKARGMRIIALKRPKTAGFSETVNGPHGLRRAVEKFLPEFYPLHSGLTTGTCATAAAIAATLQLHEREVPDEVPVLLPNGETISVAIGYGEGYAYCIKDAGDDPDATNGLEIRATVKESERFEIKGGEGVGRFTLPGFDFPPGEPAINQGPRQMMRNNIREDVSVTISVPEGRQAALKTFNPRLGIEGGISIIGVSGITLPYSEEAFIESIHKCLEVAKASGSDHIVINSGAKSENALKAKFPQLPMQCFVQYGNYIGRTLQMAGDLGFHHVTLGMMLGKAVKLAEGHLDTHSRNTVMNKGFIASLLKESGISITENYTLARELWTLIPDDRVQVFASTVIRHCLHHLAAVFPPDRLSILLISDEGGIYRV